MERILVGGTSVLISLHARALLVAGTVDGVVADLAIADVAVAVGAVVNEVGDEDEVGLVGAVGSASEVAGLVGVVGLASGVGDEGEDMVGMIVEDEAVEGAVTLGLEGRRLSRVKSSPLNERLRVLKKLICSFECCDLGRHYTDSCYDTIRCDAIRYDTT